MADSCLREHLVATDNIQLDGQLKRLKIACIAFNHPDYIQPLLDCAAILREARHDVVIVTNGKAPEGAAAMPETKRWLGRAERAGVRVVWVAGEGLKEVEQEVVRAKRGKYEDSVDTFSSKWQPFLEKKIKDLLPDIIVTDFYASCGGIVAKNLGIPYMVNMFGSFQTLQDNYGFEVASMKVAKSCCGLVYMSRDWWTTYLRMH